MSLGSRSTRVRAIDRTIDWPYGAKGKRGNRANEHGFYAWYPELRGCQSQGDTLEDAVANVRDAIELYLEILPVEERDILLSREILTTTVEVNA